MSNQIENETESGSHKRFVGIWACQKTGPFSGVTMIRTLIMVYWGLCWAPSAEKPPYYPRFLIDQATSCQCLHTKTNISVLVPKDTSTKAAVSNASSTTPCLLWHASVSTNSPCLLECLKYNCYHQVSRGYMQLRDTDSSVRPSMSA